MQFGDTRHVNSHKINDPVFVVLVYALLNFGSSSLIVQKEIPLVIVRYGYYPDDLVHNSRIFDRKYPIVMEFYFLAYLGNYGILNT